MADPLIPIFSSEELQKAVTAARPTLEGVDEARNRVSKDIKALESYLHRLDLKSSFRYPLGKCFDPEDQHLAAALEYNGNASGGVVEEALVWGEYGNAGYRLLYESSRWDGYVDVDVPGGPLFWEESTLERDAKPLIETKFEIRKRMYQHLPGFVSALAKHFDVGARPDDTPF